MSEAAAFAARLEAFLSERFHWAEHGVEVEFEGHQITSNVQMTEARGHTYDEAAWEIWTGPFKNQVKITTIHEDITCYADEAKRGTVTPCEGGAHPTSLRTGPGWWTCYKCGVEWPGPNY